MKYCIKLLLFSSFMVALTNNLSAQNPLDWKEIKAPLSSYKKGIHNLIISLKTNSNVEVVWVKFE